MEPLAYGELALKPWELDRLTPREFRLMLEGFHRREDRAWYKVATLGMWVLSPWTKKRLSVLKLLGRTALKLWPKGPERDMTEQEKVTARAIAKAAALRWVRNDRERRELID